MHEFGAQSRAPVHSQNEDGDKCAAYSGISAIQGR